MLPQQSKLALTAITFGGTLLSAALLAGPPQSEPGSNGFGQGKSDGLGITVEVPARRKARR